MGRIADSAAERRLLRQPGAIMFVSCYELGHQPLGIAQPMGFLEQIGFAPVGLDIAVEALMNRPSGLRDSSASRYPCTRRSGSGCGSLS